MQWQSCRNLGPGLFSFLSCLSPLPWSRLGAWSPAAAVGGLAVLTGFEGAGSGEEEIAFQMSLPLLNWNGQV